MAELSDEEYMAIGRVAAKNSFAGFAFVDEEFKITWANQQFRKVLGVMAGDILDVPFTDITPEPYRSLEKKHANLVMEKRIPSYIMDKDFMLEDGRVVPTISLVHGVYCNETGKFLYSISQLMARDTELSPDIPSQPVSKGFIKILFSNSKTWLTIFTGLGIVISIVIERLFAK